MAVEVACNDVNLLAARLVLHQWVGIVLGEAQGLATDEFDVGIGLAVEHPGIVLDELHQILGIIETADREITEVSGGQLQRVLLARTFAQGTPFLFLDEPGSNLDIKYRAELCDYLCKWAENKTLTPYGEVKNTIVAVFHDLGQARSVCNRTVFLKNGKIVADGKSSEVITPECLESVYDFDVAGYIKNQVIIR